ncbi:molybdopterin-dependent oxidoreductase [Longispora sp. NPDC051575]|uniref:molybdopterin-dependent oxidoreductase n=1 Tax=Longispora sp. NPDC051575 TaxID=3154943 RepID=UPI0034180DCE
MWPERLRVGPFRRGAFTSRLRSPRLTSQLGLLLAVAFGVCFLTGLLSHLIQHPPSWFWWPSRPVWLYRVTQGLHVATGLAAVPLLAAKLWSVFPKLFAWPPFRDPVHALERLSVLVLASSALFQLVTGVLNIARWYDPMPFGFVAAHYWTAWLAIGSLMVHISVKLPIVRRALGATPRPTPGDGLSRRGLLTAVAATAAAVTVATVGQTVRPLRDLSVLAPRRPDTGPQGLPVNTSAAAARIVVPVDFRLLLVGPRARHTLSLADLAALPQRTVSLPITCVEGWSADATWTGVRVADLLALVGAPGEEVLVESLQQDSPYRSSVLAPPHARDPLTLLALRLNGEVLHPDHGYPCRLIAPNRPGVMQTKWVSSMTVVTP